MVLYEVPLGEREGMHTLSRSPGGMRSCLRSRDVSRGRLDLRNAGRVPIFFTDLRSVRRIQIANGSRIQVRLDRPTHAKTCACTCAHINWLFTKITCMDMDMDMEMHMDMEKHMDMDMHMHMHMDMHMDMDMDMDMSMHMCMSMHIHIHISMHMCMHMCMDTNTAHYES